MTEVVCALIAAAATVICAAVAAGGRRRDKEQAEANARAEARADQRAKEGKLMLKMISCNTKLTVGLCDAVKNGHCNGNIDGPLAEVQQAQDEYREFLSSIALDEIKGASK